MMEFRPDTPMRRSPYNVPGSYFEALEESVMARIEQLETRPCGAELVEPASGPRRMTLTLRRAFSAVGVAAVMALFAMVTHAYIRISTDDAAVVLNSALMGYEYTEDANDFAYDFLGFDNDEIYDYVMED